MMEGRVGRTLAVAWLFVATGCGPSGEEDAANADVSATLAETIAWPDSLTVSEARPHTFSSGETLQGVLRDLGLAMPEALRLSAAVDEVQPVRDIRPGAELWLYVTPDETPERFVLWRDRLSGVEVVRNGDEWRPAPVSRTLDRYVRFVRGTLQTNFYEAMLEAGGDAALVLAVSDILQWDVDFFVDPRPGDRFSILVEEWASGQDLVRHGDILAVQYDGAHASASAYRLPGDDGEVRYFRQDGTSVQRTLLKSPLNYRRISSHFTHSRFHPILHKYRPHLGVDYAAPIGTPVVSIGDGVITFAGTKRGFGKTVVVRHNASLTTQYAHFSRIKKGVRKGARVKQNDVVGYVGSSGLSTGPHLDFRSQVNGAWVNPLTLERPPADPVPESDRARFEAIVLAYDVAADRIRADGFLSWVEFESACVAVSGAHATVPFRDKAAG